MDEERLAELVEAFKASAAAALMPETIEINRINSIKTCPELEAYDTYWSTQVVAEDLRSGTLDPFIQQFATERDLNPKELGTVIDTLLAPHFDKREQELDCGVPLIG